MTLIEAGGLTFGLFKAVRDRRKEPSVCKTGTVVTVPFNMSQPPAYNCHHLIPRKSIDSTPPSNCARIFKYCTSFQPHHSSTLCALAPIHWYRPVYAHLRKPHRYTLPGIRRINNTSLDICLDNPMLILDNTCCPLPKPRPSFRSRELKYVRAFKFLICTDLERSLSNHTIPYSSKPSAFTPTTSNIMILVSPAHSGTHGFRSASIAPNNYSSHQFKFHANA